MRILHLDKITPKSAAVCIRFQFFDMIENIQMQINYMVQMVLGTPSTKIVQIILIG